MMSKLKILTEAYLRPLETSMMERLCENMSLFNPSHASRLYLYSLETSENQRFSDAFRGYRDGLVA